VAGVINRNVLLVAILALGSAAWATNFMVISPLLPLIADDFGVSDAAVGQLATLYGVVAGIGALLNAPLMDRYSRGRLLQFGCGMLGLGILTGALAPGFGWLFLGRALAGVGAAFVMPATLAAASDIFQDVAKRNQTIGTIVAATGLSAAIGTPILTQIGEYAGWRWAMLSLLVPFAIVTFGARWLPRTSVPRLESGIADYLTRYRQVVSSRQTRWVMAGVVVRGITWYSSLIYLGAFAVSLYGLNANRLSLVFFVAGGTYFVASNIVPMLIRRTTVQIVLAAGLLVQAANFAIAGVFAGEWALFLFVIVLGLAGAATGVSDSIRMMESLPSARGAMMSLRSVANELSAALGAALTGVLLVTFNDYSAAFRILGLLLIVPLVTLAISVRQQALALEDAPQVS
jgi:MFS transporter, DHA1 family, inner membrane transport protein